MRDSLKLKGETDIGKWGLYIRKRFLRKALRLLNMIFMMGGRNPII